MSRDWHLELLWTDQIFLLLLLLAFITILLGLRQQPFRQSLYQIGHQAIALSAGVILLAFLLLAVLDSIHFKRTGADAQLTSVLDSLLYPVGQVYEKSYSAPLALRAFNSQTEVVDGKTLQIHPRLQHINPAIQTLSQRNAVIGQAFWQALLWAVIGVGLLWGIMMGLRRLRDGRFNLALHGPMLAALMTWGLLVFIAAAMVLISRDLHVLGTGKIGQDIFYYAVKSIRTGLIIGLITTLVMLPLALFLGVAAGYFGGVVDDVIQYIYTTLSSIPGVLLITASVLAMQTYIANHPEQFTSLAKSADARLLALCLILGVTSWTSLCRLLRAEALKLREVDYVLAARALGSSSLTILRKHLLPNVMHIVVITLVLDFSFLVLAEAVLSYVGVGVSPMTISWGNMINSARLELARDPIVWWPIMAAFSFMFILVLASNLFADAVRDAFDPRKR